ncbi:MAG TPA: hypothetical protein VK927_10955, partial [Adhaeribacter sp.]|nr:hypothetical protein [Adhaeribacter sp.]
AARLMQPGIMLLFTLAFTVAYFLLAHEGFYFNDDYFYASLAGKLSNGTFQPEDLPGYHRFLIFGPAALIYNLIGVNIYTVTLWPLLCTLACLVFIYFLFRREDAILTTWALILTGLNFHTLFLSTYFFPDTIIMFFALAAAGSLYAARRSGSRPVWFAFWFVLANFAALLAKETIVYYLPFYLLVAASDFFRKKHSVFWLTSLGLGVLVLFFYLLYYKITFGSFLYRFSMVENTNLLMEGNYVTDPDKDLTPRLTTAPFFFFIGSGLFFTMAFCFRFFRRQLNHSYFNLENAAAFWFWLAVVVLLQYWFGSTSINYYNPITLIPRMTTPLLPALAIAAAYQLRNYFQKPSGELWFAIPLLLAAYFNRSAVAVVYILPGLYFLGVWFLRKRRNFIPQAALFGLVLIVAQAVRPIHFMLKPSVSGFFPQEEVIKEFLNQPHQKAVLFTDGWLEQSAPYYFHFKPNPNVEFRNYLAADSVKEEDYRDRFLLVNTKTLVNPDLQYYPPKPRYNLPEAEIFRLFPNRELVAENGPVKLYRVFQGKR